MLKPACNVKEFEKYGFKKCTKDYGKLDCYYLCVSRGCKMLFVSPKIFEINSWETDDPRIHKPANCKYRDKRDYLDIVFELITNGLLVSSV